MGKAIAIVVGLAILAAIILAIVVTVQFFRNPTRGMQFFAAIAALIRSAFKSKAEAKARKHRRQDDDEPVEHEHRRRSEPRPSLIKTMRAFMFDPADYPEPPQRVEGGRRHNDSKEDR